MPPKTPSPAEQEATRRYFDLSAFIEEAKRRGDYKAAITAARETFPLLRLFVAATVREYGRWDIESSHAVHTVSPLMAVEEDRQAIMELRDTLKMIPELSDWLPVVDEAEEDLAIVRRMKVAIRAQPGIRQRKLKEKTGLSDGRRMSELLAYLERGGHIRRVRTGSTYDLYTADSPPVKIDSGPDAEPPFSGMS